MTRDEQRQPEPKNPQQRWEAAKLAFLATIEAIDNDTQWSPKEPDWWSEMATIRRELLRTTTPPQSEEI